MSTSEEYKSQLFAVKAAFEKVTWPDDQLDNAEKMAKSLDADLLGFLAERQEAEAMQLLIDACSKVTIARMYRRIVSKR